MFQDKFHLNVLSNTLHWIIMFVCTWEHLWNKFTVSCHWCQASIRVTVLTAFLKDQALGIKPGVAINQTQIGNSFTYLASSPPIFSLHEFHKPSISSLLMSEFICSYIFFLLICFSSYRAKWEGSSQDTSQSCQFVFCWSQLQKLITFFFLTTISYNFNDLFLSFSVSIKTNLISGWTSPLRTGVMCYSMIMMIVKLYFFFKYGNLYAAFNSLKSAMKGKKWKGVS